MNWPNVLEVMSGLEEESVEVLKQFVATGQARKEMTASELRSWVERLLPVDRFYREMGGVLGYHEEALRLARGQARDEPRSFYPPKLRSLDGFLEAGLDAMEGLTEVYPLGGAADRLHLIDPITGEELPAAMMPFGGRSLLEGLIADLEGREALYKRRRGKKVVVPVVLMTSEEKDNTRRVKALCEAHGGFGREIFFVEQPLVPMFTREGVWTGQMKPGGHGALWKLMRDQGAFAWLKKQGKRSLLVRQINNPIVGQDGGLLSFVGIGFSEKRSFGFYSCPRQAGAAEGVNVLVQRGNSYAISNVEYCGPKVELEGEYPANTNTLYADLEAVEEAVERSPFPGLLVNFKTGTARIESMMQNIADVITVEADKKPEDHPKTFVAFNERKKTISVTKRAFDGERFGETPEQAFYDLSLLHRELLVSCGMEVGAQEKIGEVPSVVFLFHPKLGPLFSEIREKISGGRAERGAYLNVEGEKVELIDLDLSGALTIRGNGVSLRGVKVRNRGVNWEKGRPWWRGISRLEECTEIVVEEGGELIADGVEFIGNQKIVVKAGTRCLFHREKGPEWQTL